MPIFGYSLNKLSLTFLLIVLFTASQSVAIAQDEREVPFDISGIPSVDDIKTLLDLSGVLDGLNEEEKQRQIEYTAKYISFSYVVLAANTYSACQTEVEQYCSTEPKEKINGCLIRQHDNLGTCCASNVRKMIGVSGIPEPVTYKGINLPKGSELHFSGNCQLDEISVPEETRVGDVVVAPGRLALNDTGKLASAWILDGQIYRGLPIANGTVYGTNFYETGVPTEVSIAKDVNYLGMRLKAGSHATFYENGVVASATTIQPFTDSRGRTVEGKIEFHPSGKIKSGQLAEAWKKSKIKLPVKTYVAFASNGDFESVEMTANIDLPGFRNVWGQLETHANGQIKQLYLQNQSGVAIEGVAYPAQSTIVFAEDGRVVRDNFRDKEMTPSYPIQESQKQWTFEELDKPMRIGVWEFPARSVLVADEKGIRRSATLANNIKFQNIELSSGHIEFQRRGEKFWGLTLKNPYEKDGLNLPVGAEVTVDIDGVVTFARAESDAYLNGNRIVDDTPIRFHQSGVVHRVGLAIGAELFGHRFSKTVDLQITKLGHTYSLFTDEPVTINKIQFDGDGIFFHPSGSTRSGILNLNSRIAGVLYAAGTEIILDEAGSVIHSWRRQPRWPNGKPPEPKLIDNSGVTVLVGPERAMRRQLMGPLTSDRCKNFFGEKDASGNYAKKFAAGFSMGTPMSPAQLGCGTTDAQAGILDRG